MLDWDKLRIFYIVAQTKNITKAAERLNASQSAVSRQITALESSMKTTLFHRRARGLLLTEQGDILLNTVSEFFQKLAQTENALLELSERPKGALRITAGHSFGAIWLAAQMHEFSELYPEIKVELVLEDEQRNLSMREADVAIRMYSTKNPDLVQRPLTTIHSSIYASNDYLRVYGIPKSFEELSNHRVLTLSTAGHQVMDGHDWMQRHAKSLGVELNIHFQVNNLMAMLRVVKQGMGIAVLPDYVVERARHVSRILDDVSPDPVDAYMVYSMDMKESKRIRAFRHFIQRKLTEYTF
jgi:DNA-binding transcriptional LysR family regulator